MRMACHHRRDPSRLIVGAVALLAAGAAVLALSRRGAAWPPSVQSAEFFPSLVAIGLGTAGALLVVQSAVGLPRAGAGDPGAQEGAAAEARGRGDVGPVEAPWRLGAVMLGVLAFHAAIGPFGMVVASVLAIAVLAPVLGYRRWGVALLVALITPVAVWLMFRRTLNVLLPTGWLWG